jgi:hypothetical protein
MSPWPYDARCQQGPSPSSPVFRELFPFGPPAVAAQSSGEAAGRQAASASETGQHSGGLADEPS